MTTILIKTGLGRGPEFSFDVDCVPRAGEVLIISGQEQLFTVSSVRHSPETNLVVVFTHQHATLPTRKPSEPSKE